MAMEAPGRYNLAWTDFDQYTTTAFKDLGARREFVDVTLACEGDVQVQAHKVILAACSSWFRSVLLRNSHPHPLIYLDSIGPEQLEALVGFMYTGETNIPQGEFEDFMRAAKRYRVAGLMVDGEDEEERVKQEQTNIFPLVPLEEIKKIKKKIKRETKVESRLDDTPVQSDVLTEVDVVEQEDEEEEHEQDAKEEEEEAEEEDQEEVDEADVLCKGEIVPEMNITMDADAEDVAGDEDDDEEETEEMPESDVSNLFIDGEEEGAGEIVSADTLDDMMSYDEDVNDEEDEQKEEDEEQGEDEEENDDDEEEEGEDEEDEEDPRDPDYEIEEDEEEDHVTLGETLKEETKVEPSEVFSEAITKVLIKSENENVNDMYKGTPVLSIQKKRKGCRPSTLMKVKLARSLY